MKRKSQEDNNRKQSGGVLIYGKRGARGVEDAARAQAREPHPPGKRVVVRAPTTLDADYLRERGDLRGLIDLLHYDEAPEAPVEAVEVRQAAALALPDFNDRRAVDGLLGALSDPSPVVQAAAVEGLGRLAAGIPVTGAAVRAGGLTTSERTRILAALFPLLKRTEHLEVRTAAVEALYQAGGHAVFRPLLAQARHASEAFQSWFVRWLVRIQQDNLLLDLYPWASERVRELIAERLRRRMAQPVLRRLERAAQSQDPDLEELLARVFG